MSTVVLTFEDRPQVGQDVLWGNPLVHVIAMMRRGIYGIYDAPWVSPVYVCAVSAILIFLAMALLGRYQREIVNQEFD